jgi:hypothetical protein
MNDLENYKVILETHFGAGVTTFATTNGATNNVIGALNRTNFAQFQSAFFQRMKRLAGRYPNQDSNRKHLLDTLNLLATEKNWDGAYAELVAFDFLNADEDWLSSPINLSKTVPATETLASGLGMQNANLDGYYDDFGVCFDVKVLSDKSRAILDGVIAEVKRRRGIVAVISPEYPLNFDYEVFQQNRPALASELENEINPTAKTTLVRSKIVPELTYRLMWGGGVLTTISTYDPYIHAEEHHKLLFAHIKKFSKVMPGLIVFVVFPWFSEKVTNQIDSTDIFYRAFCRRFFCQYAKDATPAKSFLKSFAGNESVAQVAEKLSGVLFLEDVSITSSNAHQQNIKAFAYLNPNATHKVSRHFRHHLSSLKCFVDDLEHDNY